MATRTDDAHLRLTFLEDVVVADLHRSAYDLDNLDAIADALELIERDASVKAVVLRGTAETFWLGASVELLRHMSALPPSDLLALIKRGQRSVTALLRCSKLVVAYIEGFVAGGGFDLALACDRVLVTEKARANLFYSKLGVVPDQGGLFLLADRLGWSAALNYAAESPSWSAEELLSLGLADRKVEAGMDADRLRRALRKDLRVPASTQAALKRLRWHGMQAEWSRHLDEVAGAMSNLLALPEQQKLVEQMGAMQRLKGTHS